MLRRSREVYHIVCCEERPYLERSDEHNQDMQRPSIASSEPGRTHFIVESSVAAVPLASNIALPSDIRLTRSSTSQQGCRIELARTRVAAARVTSLVKGLQGQLSCPVETSPASRKVSHHHRT